MAFRYRRYFEMVIFTVPRRYLSNFSIPILTVPDSAGHLDYTVSSVYALASFCAGRHGVEKFLK